MKKILKNLHHLKKYSYIGIINIFINVLYTKINFPQALLARRPIYFRNLGSLSVGKGFLIGPCGIIDVLHKDAYVKIGDNVKINHRFHLGAMFHIEIDDNVLIGSNVTMIDHNHGVYSGNEQSSPFEITSDRSLVGGPIIIKENVWISENVVVLPNVTIGKCSIVGAGAIVTTNIPPYTISAGNPSRVIKRYDFDAQKWKRAD